MRRFATEAEFVEAIDATMPPDRVSDPVRAALTAGIRAGEAEARDVPPNADGALNLRLGGWILRDQDIPMTELIGIVGVAATAVLASGVIAAGAVVTALTAFAAMAWKAWRKGAKLSKAELAVLGFLEMQGPMSLDDLKTRAPAALPDVTVSDIENAMASLRDVELRDGDIVELIREDAAGLWRTRGV